MWNLLRWVWRRISDWYTGIDLLELFGLFGWKTWVSGVITASVASATAALLNAPAWAIFALAIAGLCIVLGLVIVWQNLFGSIKNIEIEARKGEYLPLREAAVSLYSIHRAVQSMWAQAAESMSGHGITRGSPEAILDYMAIVISGKKDIYGKRIPSNMREKISKADLRRCHFVKGATKLEDNFPGSQLCFVDLEVRTVDLDDLIQEVQNNPEAFREDS